MHLCRKLIFFIFLVTITNHKSFAQKFNIICDTTECNWKFVPHIFMSGNLFDDGCDGKSISMQNRNNKFSGSVSLQIPFFISLANTQLLAIPNKDVSGVLKRFGDIFIINDTDNVNRFFRDINDSITNIVIQYSKNTDFDKFLILFDSLKNYINRAISYIASPPATKRYEIDILTVTAINQYCNARLAHFSVLPILLNGKYTTDLNKLIEAKFKNIDANYWLQVQPGRIFLRTYFTRVVLPKNNYDLQKSLAYSPLFRVKNIRDYATYHYFRSWLSNDSTSNNLELIEKQFIQFQTMNKFTEAEQSMLSGLKGELMKTGSNIIPLFSKQLLTNEKGRLLSISEKNAILSKKGNIIIDYWASWCAPCISYIRTLKSDEIVYKGEKYKIIFISIDKNKQDWLSKSYPVIRPYNSFRLVDLNKFSFYKAFEITAIPRLFLIKNGVLINQNFEKENL